MFRVTIKARQPSFEDVLRYLRSRWREGTKSTDLALGRFAFDFRHPNSLATRVVLRKRAFTPEQASAIFERIALAEGCSGLEILRRVEAHTSAPEKPKTSEPAE